MSPKAGYSKRALVQKLGIKPGHRCLLVQPPRGFMTTLGELPEGATMGARIMGEFDFIHAFFESSRELRALLPRLKKALSRKGMLWVSWRKGKVSDLTETLVRDKGLDAGLVDVKVCAVDESWSGLKLVYRLRDRKVAKK